MNKGAARPGCDASCGKGAFVPKVIPSIVRFSLVLLLCAARPVSAQDAGLPAVLMPGQFVATPAPPSPSESPSFRSGVDIVALTVTVIDTQQGYVSDLRAQDFQVFEDGVQQPVSFFGVSDVPMDVALLVDSSASMRGKLPVVQEAATGLLRMLRQQDRASLVEFRQGVRIVEPLTDDISKVVQRLQGMQPGGGTSLYNALYVSLKEFQKQARVDGRMRRRAIVVLSDGEDTSSMLSFDDVVEQARRSGVTIYTVSLKSALQLAREKTQNNGRRYFSQADYTMRALAEETGARAFFPEDEGELKAIYASVGQELAAQYAVGYVPRNPIRNGAWRRLVVKIAERPNARPRTRAGYYAAAHSEAVASN